MMIPSIRTCRMPDRCAGPGSTPGSDPTRRGGQGRESRPCPPVPDLDRSSDEQVPRQLACDEPARPDPACLAWSVGTTP